MKSTVRFVGLAALGCLLGLVCVSQHAVAQPPGRGGFGGGFMGGFMNPSGLGLLGDEKVQKELDLDESQLERIRGLQEDMQAEMREAFSGLRDRFREGNREEIMQEIREMTTEITDEFDSQLDKELLDHQKQRLKQLVFRAQSRRSGGAAAGSLPEGMIKELGITEEQKTQMIEKARSVKEDLDKKIANLQKQAEEEVLAVLTKEQQEKYKELMGEAFEFSQPRFPGMGGGRGGRGGRGDGGGRGEGGEQGSEGGSRDGNSDRDF